MRYVCDPDRCKIDAFKDRRARREADEDALVDAAMRDIIAGRFDTDAVYFALQLGHHDEYAKLKEAHDLALRGARATGASHG
jgi:hypothetical protein